MDLKIKDKKVLVAGSSQGIGFAIAKGFLEEGAMVCITGRDEKKLLFSYQKLSSDYGEDRLLFFVGDLTNEEKRSDLKIFLRKQWNGIDILIPNIGSGKPLNKNPLDLDEWKRLIDINLFSAVGMINDFWHLFYPDTDKDRSIVLISSIVAKNVLGTSYAYAVAKNGLLTLTKYLAKKAAEEGIRVNAVVPGNIKFAGGRWEEIEAENPESVARMLEQEVALKRFGKPEEIADAVVFLASERAKFITGAAIVVDGGQIR